MEDDTRANILVPPLRILKLASDSTSSTSKVRMPVIAAPPAQRSQMTPPPTPLETNRLNLKVSGSPGSNFQSFLRAFCPFRPSVPVSTSTVTLQLDAGNIILIHSIHVNGWADGTLLDNGARGWLPTNYCQGYDHASIRPLLKALTDFWDVMRSRNGSTIDPFSSQDYMRGLIAGVRFLLEKSDCLTRDSVTVKAHDHVRRTRKALLSDLSSLVKMAKSLQDIASSSTSSHALDEAWSKMLPSAFRVATRGVKFLDVWLEVWNGDTGLNKVVENVATTQGRAKAAGHGVSNFGPYDSTGTDLSDTGSSVVSRSDSYVADSARASRSRQATGFGSPLHRSEPSRPSACDRPLALQSKHTSISHRMTSDGYATGPMNSNLASERLKTNHDTFLGCLGTFLGLHMQSRSSSELLLTTQQSIKSCRELLAVIEVVLDHETERSAILDDAKGAMYDNITTLVHAARDIFRPANAANEDVVFIPDEGRRLISAARDCVRSAGECVAMTRAVLERIGDFEPEAAELQSSTIDIAPPGPARQTDRTSEPTNVDAEHIRTADADADCANAERGFPTGSSPGSVPWETGISHNRPSTSPSDSSPQPATTGRTTVDMAKDVSALSSARRQPPFSGSLARTKNEAAIRQESTTHAPQHMPLQGPGPPRGVLNGTGSNSTHRSSARDSDISGFSVTSTRATSPGGLSQHLEADESGSRSSRSQTPLCDDVDETEKKILEKTFAHELMYNKNGQIVGGSLPALIEKLTAHDSPPDALFVSTFYLTFRLFSSPQDLAEALAYRFHYVGETPTMAGPVRLRVYNAFKCWLESHWRHDCDDVALPCIRDFANHALSEVLPAPGRRLSELAEKVAEVHGPLVPRLVSTMGKTNTSIAQYVNPDAPVPAPIMSKTQLAALKSWKMGGSAASVLDFDPLELARQITIKESAIFCSILPEELLAIEWMKRSGSLAVNVRSMSTLSTDLANFVADSILQPEEPKKRASLIKQWVKVANKCLELKNYDSVMAIVCSLSSSTIARLRKTWDTVSQKTKATLEELKKIVDVSRNHVVLRQRLQNHVPPCLPFVGIYLTDLTFVDHGNPTSRQLTTGDGSTAVINFDKHMKTAKVISELQRFQIPYRLTEVPELQTWIQDQLVRVRSAGEKSFQTYYRRSLVLEPRDQALAGGNSTGLHPPVKSHDRSFDFLGWANAHRDKSIATNG